MKLFILFALLQLSFGLFNDEDEVVVDVDKLFFSLFVNRDQAH